MALSLKNDVLTVDILLHTLACIAISLFCGSFFAGPIAMYLREQGQARSWTLNGSLHKHAEWVVPTAITAILWPFLGGIKQVVGKAWTMG